MTARPTRRGPRRQTRWPRSRRRCAHPCAPGETLLLTGSSGAGKSTLLGLLAGLATPTEGVVVLWGRPILSLQEPDLRMRLTLLPQRSALMAGTVRENLRLAAPDLTDAAAWDALEAVALGRHAARAPGWRRSLARADAAFPEPRRDDWPVPGRSCVAPTF